MKKVLFYILLPIVMTKSYFTLFFTKLQRVKKLKYIEVHLVDHCNLRCAYCTHFAPLSKPSFCDIDVFKKDLSKLSSLTNGELYDIRLLGGEPLLNPNCHEFIKIARQYFPNSKISLVTNGILLKKQDEIFWETCRDNKVVIACTKYPLKMDYDSIQQYVLDKNVDFAYAKNPKNQKFINFALSKQGKINPLQSYYPCVLCRDLSLLKNGKLYLCPIVGNIEILNEYFNLNFQVTNKDYINIHEVSDIKEILDFLSKRIPFCRYCSTLQNKTKTWKKSNKEIEEWCID